MRSDRLEAELLEFNGRMRYSIQNVLPNYGCTMNIYLAEIGLKDAAIVSIVAVVYNRLIQVILTSTNFRLKFAERKIFFLYGVFLVIVYNKSAHEKFRKTFFPPSSEKYISMFQTEMEMDETALCCHTHIYLLASLSTMKVRLLVRTLHN